MTETRFPDDKDHFEGTPETLQFRQINYDLCRAVNMTDLSIVLNKMESVGLPHNMVVNFIAIAHNLLDLMRTENNRIFKR